MGERPLGLGLNPIVPLDIACEYALTVYQFLGLDNPIYSSSILEKIEEEKSCHTLQNLSWLANEVEADLPLPWLESPSAGISLVTPEYLKPSSLSLRENIVLNLSQFIKTFIFTLVLVLLLVIGIFVSLLIALELIIYLFISFVHSLPDKVSSFFSKR